MNKDVNLTSITAKALLEQRSRLVSALSMFRPTIKQEEFFREMQADQLLEIGVTGRNRGGKSVATAVWFASVVLDAPVTMRNGEKLYMRPERWRNQEMLCWLVGYDWKHNGETLYRLLFRPNLFRIIRDLHTREWRSYDPTNPDDKNRKSESQPSPPLITESMVDPNSWSWESKKDRQLHSIKLKKDNTRVVFYASTGEVAAGNPVHVIWIDEKIQSDAHYNEWLMRLVDYEGRLVWSSWPTLSPTGAFAGLAERAVEQRSSSNPTAMLFEFRRGDNPYTENKTLNAALETMSDEEAAARGDGQVQMGRWMMYPRFSVHTHRVMGNDPEADDELAKAIRANGGVPIEWTRYLILDPGTINCGVLKIAIPPPKFGDFVIPYQEHFLHYKSADEVAQIIKAGSHSGSVQEVFEDFIIDWRAGRQTPMGFSGTICQNYERAFKLYGLRCQRRGANFRPSDDNLLMRQAKLDGMMHIGSNGYPRLRIINCPELVQQLTKYRRAQDSLGNPTDEPAKHQKIDLAVAMEYAAALPDMIYVPSKPRSQEVPTLVTIMKDMMKQYGITPKQLDESIYCGPGRAPSE